LVKSALNRHFRVYEVGFGPGEVFDRSCDQPLQTFNLSRAQFAVNDMNLEAASINVSIHHTALFRAVRVVRGSSFCITVS
jgi:hypothetical protein